MGPDGQLLLRLQSWRPLRTYIGVGIGAIDLAIDDRSARSRRRCRCLRGRPWQASPSALQSVSISTSAIVISSAERSRIRRAWRPGELDYTHQAVTVGLRWQFAAPAPPPPPPPPPYLPPPPPPPPPAGDVPDVGVRRVLRVGPLEPQPSRARKPSMQRSTARVSAMSAASSSSATPTRRARRPTTKACRSGALRVVRDALVARGIAAGSITTQARGETDLARATRDGVREPLNRRTAVTISFR